ncbi:DUF2637 domain-containing protein [Mycolicibacterium aubagnense]|nr:DUF2637 domain-containing protein [Mycolicibacterium aubagnense]
MDPVEFGRHYDAVGTESSLRSDDLTEARRTYRRAVRFHWAVVIVATSFSIAGNAAEKWAHPASASPLLAALVAATAPVVLLASSEGMALMIKARRRPSRMAWFNLALTGFLALAAFRMSFDSLRDLGIQCGMPASLAWLLPVVIDVPIVQATCNLDELHRIIRPTLYPNGWAQAAEVVDVATVDEPAELVSEPVQEELIGTELEVGPRELHSAVQPVETDRRHEAAAHAVADSRHTKQAPEVIAAVLQKHAAGMKVGRISDELDLHHTTVRRIVNAKQTVAATA